VPDIVNAVNQQNQLTPASGSADRHAPAPSTYTVRTQRLLDEEESATHHPASERLECG
jgi:hypothetical protein